MKPTAAVLAARLAVAGPGAPPKPFADQIDAFAAVDDASFPAPCQTLFVGSSSIRYWDTLAEDMAPRPVIQRGFGGSQMEHVLLYFDEIVAPYRPGAIVLYEGENDLSFGGKTPEDLRAEFEEFLDMKSAALGETPVYFLSIKPSKLRFGELAEQTRANALIAEVAAARDDVVYIDVVSAMIEADGRPKDIFIVDNLHLTAEGYTIWTPIVADALDTAETTTAPGCG